MPRFIFIRLVYTLPNPPDKIDPETGKRICIVDQEEVVFAEPPESNPTPYNPDWEPGVDPNSGGGGPDNDY